MNCFKVKVIMRYNGKDYKVYNPYDIIFAEREAVEETIKLDWNNVQELIDRHHLHSDLSVEYGLFGGRIFKYDTLTERKVFRESQYCFLQDADIELIFSETPYNPSIKEVMENRDGLSAIQYLVERGLNVTKP